MISEEFMRELIRQTQEAQRWWHRPIQPAPQLRLNQQGMLELAEPDTHDEWCRLNEEG